MAAEQIRFWLGPTGYFNPIRPLAEPLCKPPKHGLLFELLAVELRHGVVQGLAYSKPVVDRRPLLAGSRPCDRKFT